VNVRTADEAGEIILRPWAAELELPDDTIELTFDSAAGHGLAPEALVDDDQTACQAWAASRRPSALPERRDGTGVGLTRLSVVPCMRARICELSAMSPDASIRQRIVARRSVDVTTRLPQVGPRP
jgi:hypothetical protein